MQQKQNRLTRVQRVTFGTTASTRRTVVNGILGAVILAMLVWQMVGGAPFSPGLLVPLVLSAFVALVSLTNRRNFEISFVQGMYYILTGSWPAVRVMGGRLSEISHLSLTRILYYDTITYATYIVFRPEVKREPYRLDDLACSVSTGDFADRFSFCLELATRLDVPVFDDSGWNGGGVQLSEPKLIVIHPGETHPALLHPAPKWNKW